MSRFTKAWEIVCRAVWDDDATAQEQIKVIDKMLSEERLVELPAKKVWVVVSEGSAWNTPGFIIDLRKAYLTRAEAQADANKRNASPYAQREHRVVGVQLDVKQ